MIPLINGDQKSWIDINIILFGVPVVGITKVEYSVKQEKANIYAIGKNPVGRGHGRVTYEGSFDILLDEWQRIVRAAPNRNALDIPRFDINMLIYSDDRVILPTATVLKNCEFTENNFSSAEGDTSITITVPFIFAGISEEL